MGNGEEGGRPLDLLIVEDQRMFAQLLRRVFDNTDDIKVRGVATTAADAAAMARSLVPDVVLMDYFLADGNGVSATREILSDHPDTKVVMLTAVEDESVFLAAIDAGCCGFISKSRDFEDLEDAVRAAHAGEALITGDMLKRVLAQVKRGPAASAGARLTPRELEVLTLMSRAMTNPEIARKLQLSQKTVRNHVQNILEKLGTHSKLEAVTAAARRGILSVTG